MKFQKISMILTMTVKEVQINNRDISWPPEGEHHSFNRLTAVIVGDTVGTLVDLCARILFMMTCSGL